jgi:DNA-binding response OmpR family regulator
MSRILVVDDSRLVLQAIGETLASQYDVAFTENPLEVPHLLHERMADLVLIDLNMPTMRGDVVARIIRKAFGNDVVVLLHTEVPEQAKALLEGCGANGVVPKSQDEDALRAAVALHLRKQVAHARAS